MKKLIFILSMAFLLMGRVNAQTVVSDNYYVHVSGSNPFNSGPGAYVNFYYGIDGSSNAYVDLTITQPSTSTYNDHDITYMEASFAVFDAYDSPIYGDFDNRSAYQYEYLNNHTNIHLEVPLPSGAAKIVFYYFIDSQDPFYDPADSSPNPHVCEWVMSEDREVIVSVP